MRERHGKDDRTASYLYAFMDLNGDGKEEAIVHLLSRWWCGSGGCPTFVLVQESTSYRVVSKILLTRPPIRALATTSKGWRDIGVWVQGGGILTAYEAALSFDGKTYPLSAANPPARRLVGGVEGDDVIPSLHGATALYP